MSKPATIGAVISRHAELRPNLPAIVATGFVPLSYRELKEYLDLVTVRLRAAGFDRSARIAVALPNSADAALVIVAIASASVAAPIDLQLTAPEMERRLALLQPRAVVVPGDSRSAARDVAVRLGLAIIEAKGDGHGTLGLDLNIPRGGPPAASQDPDATSPAFILQTSGTTADSKLIPLSHGNMLAAAARVQSWLGLGPADRCLSVSRMCYGHGLRVTILSPLLTGGSVAFPASLARVDIAEWFTRLNPTWYSAGPTLHRFVLDKTKSLPNARSLHALRFIFSTGAALPRDVLEGLAATLGVPVVECYSATEAAQISANLPPPAPYKPGTSGIPAEGVLRIVGADGRDVAAGTRGEILVGGPTVIAGYLDAPELNRVAFVDGWFRTGDIGSLDDDGFLTLHGRNTEVINRGGEKISPAEIDAALLSHPDVAEAAAFAVPHRRLGEDIAAAVVVKPGAQITPLDLRRFLLQKLAPFKIPHRVEFVEHLPKGPTGKVQRRRLVT